jgi:pimeloyl-ACP methyl ester carboxylesterase
LTPPPLLFVHGICHGAWCWEEQYTPFFSGHGFDTHALDLRGHGVHGLGGLNQATLEDYAADVVVAASALPRPPVIIGHSMGGAITQLVLRDRPDVLAGAVLLASMPPTRPTAREMLRIQRSFLGGVALQKLLKGKQLSISEVRRLPFFGGRISPGDAERYGSLLQAESQSAIRGLLKLSLPRSRPDVPVLVIGSRRDRIFGAATIRRTAAHFGVEPVVLGTGCHDLMLDPEWEGSALRILAWLKDRS